MNWSWRGKPTRKRIIRLSSIGASLIVLSVVGFGVSQTQTLPADWIAATAKYVGLIVSSILGIVGTTTDTKDRGDDGRYRLRPVGWVVTAAIGIALVVGALGQYYEDEQQDRRAGDQVRRLQEIAQLAQKSLKPFSGKVEVAILFGLPLDQFLLKDLVKKHEHVWFEMRLGEISGLSPRSFNDMSPLRIAETDALERKVKEVSSQIRCRFTINAIPPRGRPLAALMEIDSVAVSPTYTQALGYLKAERMLTAEARMTNTATTNQGIYSAVDFPNRIVIARCYHSPESRNLDWPIRVGPLIALPLAVEIYDGALKTPLARAPLSPMEWEKFDARYSSNMQYCGYTEIPPLGKEPGSLLGPRWSEGTIAMYNFSGRVLPTEKAPWSLSVGR